MASRQGFTLNIDPNRCTGCGWCVAACPLNLLSLEVRTWKKTSVIHNELACIACRKCEAKCLFGAIDVRSIRPVAGDNGDHHVQSRHAGC